MRIRPPNMMKCVVRSEPFCEVYTDECLSTKIFKVMLELACGIVFAHVPHSCLRVALSFL